MAGVHGFMLSSRQQKAAEQPLSYTFAMVEVRADWKFHVEIFELWKTYWKSTHICHRCPAVRLARQVLGQIKLLNKMSKMSVFIHFLLTGRHGQLYTIFKPDFWHERLWDTETFLACCKSEGPCPLVMVEGFHVEMVSLGIGRDFPR